MSELRGFAGTGVGGRKCKKNQRVRQNLAPANAETNVLLGYIEVPVCEISDFKLGMGRAQSSIWVWMERGRKSRAVVV